MMKTPCASALVKGNEQGVILVICSKLDYKIEIVGLNFCLVGGFVSYDLSALFTAMQYDITSLCIGLSSARSEDSAAGICSVSRVYVNV
jgi:hypothetical protein